MKTILKLSLILIISTFFSCGDLIITDESFSKEPVFSKPYVVDDIEDFDNYRCKYILSTNTDYIHYDDKISFLDSIGKFNLRDTIYVDFIKK